MITSNEYSIKVKNVAKMYKMYKSNLAKISDLLGLPFEKDYEEFWPLKDINISIKKGEKVGIIGRNGAGKTTLLSMIADNLKPTKGEISVYGHVSALFVLGTGFHPEFSGRENIYSSLAFQGITGEEAKKLEKEIVEFAELEQFIDQPVKTYSAGMYARLAFTVATAIKPDILIIDEILGAGDAYFASKAVERMKNLTSGGSTVLFVSHDLASVQQMCERCIWIDKGKIREDGNTLSVIKSYSADVRRREELRLMKKNALNIKDEPIDKQLIFRFIGEDGTAPQIGLPIHRITLYVNNEQFSEILVGDSMDNNIQENAYLLTDNKSINWSEPKKENDKWCREFIDLKRTNIHAAGIFVIPANIDLEDLDFEIEYLDNCDKIINFEIYNNEESTYRTFLKIEPNQTKDFKSISTKSYATTKEFKEIMEKDIVEQDDVYGSGEIEVIDYYLTNQSNEKKYVFSEKEELSINLTINIKKTLKSNPYFGYAIFNLSGILISNHFEEISAKNVDKYNIKICFKNSIYLKKNKYIMTIGFYKSIDLYNVDKEWDMYVVLDRKIEFTIENDSHIALPEGIINLIPQINLSNCE